jgi:1,4-dihydroxy-2-naphthoate octaprenyltransferase
MQALAAGLLLGLFSSAIITINEVPDIEADTKAGKKNLVVRYGKDFGIRFWTILLWGAMFLVFSFGVGWLFPKTTLLALIMTVPIFLITFRADEKTRQLPGVVARCRFTILSQLGTWFLLAIGFLWAKAAGL